MRPGPGQLVVNLGDMMGRWTNDRWKSTVGFFLHPNYDARVECLPTCADAEHPPRYAPILAGEHMLAKLERRETRPTPVG